MKTLTASDRKSLIRLASSLPKGSPERRAILAGLKKAASPMPEATFWQIIRVYSKLSPKQRAAQALRDIQAFAPDLSKAFAMQDSFVERYNILQSRMAREIKATGNRRTNPLLAAAAAIAAGKIGRAHV